MTQIYIQQLPAAYQLSALPQWRRQQALSFKFAKGQEECAVSYLLLCKALTEVFGITVQPEFTVGEHGKPTLKDMPGIHFNMSHCHNAVAVAVSDKPVGIDIERVGRYSESVAKYALNDKELQAVQQSPSVSNAFIRLWTQKEAVTKLTGEGITDNMKALLDETDAHILTVELPDMQCVMSAAQTEPWPDDKDFIVICK